MIAENRAHVKGFARLRALREDARYFCIETGKTYAGRTLMHLGLSAELNGDFDSGVFYFQAVKEG